MGCRNSGRRRQPSRHSRRRNALPAGFTLIELLVALVLLDVGVLALVTLGAALARAASGTRASATAMNVATARLEHLAASPCAFPAAASATPALGVTESFSDLPAPNGTRSLRDSVAVLTSRGAHTVVLETRDRC